jgi:dedicator of cytokinesis protein 3
MRSTCSVSVCVLVGLLGATDARLNSALLMLTDSMIVSEYSLDGDFTVIQTEVIDRLDKLFSQRKGDEISRAFFTTQLRGLFDSSDIDDTLRTQVAAFLESVNEFLDLLLGIRNLPDGEEYQDDRGRDPPQTVCRWE